MIGSLIAECQELGFLPCISNYGGCTLKDTECTTSCSANNECLSGCCIIQKCLTKEYCQEYIPQQPQQQQVDKSSGDNSMTILPIVLPICILVFVIVMVITIRCYLRKRNERMKAQRIQTIKVENEVNINMNGQMGITNELNAAELNGLQLQQSQQLQQQQQIKQQYQFQSQQQFYGYSKQNYPQEYTFNSQQQPAIYGVVISSTNAINPKSDEEQLKEPSKLTTQKNKLVVGKADSNYEENATYL